MGDFNMPPGVSVNDIPGNRPEDIEEEAFWNELDTRFVNKVGEDAAESFFKRVITESLVEYVNIAREMTQTEAWNEFKAEQEIAAALEREE